MCPTPEMEEQGWNSISIPLSSGREDQGPTSHLSAFLWICRGSHLHSTFSFCSNLRFPGDGEVGPWMLLSTIGVGLWSSLGHPELPLLVRQWAQRTPTVDIEVVKIYKKDTKSYLWGSGTMKRALVLAGCAFGVCCGSISGWGQASGLFRDLGKQRDLGSGCF